jgi:hypothetical protein
MEPVPNTPYFLFASWPPRWIRYDFIINIPGLRAVGFFVGLMPRQSSGATGSRSRS